MEAEDENLFAASKPSTGVPPQNVLALQQKARNVLFMKRIAF